MLTLIDYIDSKFEIALEQKEDDNEYRITLYLVDKYNKELKNMINIVVKDIYLANKVKELFKGVIK